MADEAFTPGVDINAALFEIYQRQPDNASVVLTVQGHRMTRLLEHTLTR